MASFRNPSTRPVSSSPVASNHDQSELIAQITQSVIENLQTGRTIGNTSPSPLPNSFLPPSSPVKQLVPQPVPQSPSNTSRSSPNLPNRLYTPPSPHTYQDYPTDTSPHLGSGCIPGERKYAHVSRKESLLPDGQCSGKSEKRPTRPKGPPRLSTSKGITTLERIWGPLFDEEAHPTVKLGQFLRGLAVHIIEDYEPQHSLVITPAKMVRYYEEVKLSKEVYSWSFVFHGEHSSISKMYRNLECEHHLLQGRYEEKPNIPGLTPFGFERWVTLFIQAHPDKEFERLRKAVLAMPISNPDDEKERFPKEISRRLFPGHEDRKVRTRIEGSMSERAAVGDIAARVRRNKPPIPAPHHNRRRNVRFADQPTSLASSSSYVPSHVERGKSL